MASKPPFSFPPLASSSSPCCACSCSSSSGCSSCCSCSSSSCSCSLPVSAPRLKTKRSRSQDHNGFLCVPRPHTALQKSRSAPLVDNGHTGPNNNKHRDEFMVISSGGVTLSHNKTTSGGRGFRLPLLRDSSRRRLMEMGGQPHQQRTAITAPPAGPAHTAKKQSKNKQQLAEELWEREEEEEECEEEDDEEGDDLGMGFEMSPNASPLMLDFPMESPPMA
eukprot:gb/GEZN01016210.1/.p1 GENE.gb/GEZN01016210.1/~~gb/GEZN01016210.1/.p1  ORF type:complete len:221 (-),score=61.82 gb/GEZN01016210.1/:44-706(-)